MSPIRRTGPTKTQPENSGYITGVAIGLVTQNKDDEGQCRVQVSYPWHEKPLESYWARLAMPMAGNERGLVLIPEVGDEVLVAFERGDLRFPYVLGGLWNGKRQASLFKRRWQKRQAWLSFKKETLSAVRRRRSGSRRTSA